MTTTITLRNFKSELNTVQTEINRINALPLEQIILLGSKFTCLVIQQAEIKRDQKQAKLNAKMDAFLINRFPVRS